MLKDEAYSDKEFAPWCVGVIIFTLLTGTLPFHDVNPYMLRERVAMRDLEWPKKVELSPQARDLILKSFHPYRHKRLDLFQVLDHEFFTKFGDKLPEKLPGESLDDIPWTLLNKFKPEPQESITRIV